MIVLILPNSDNIGVNVAVIVLVVTTLVLFNHNSSDIAGDNKHDVARHN